MSQPLNILFATDFSPNARVALRNLLLIKEKFAVEISLIYVVASFWRDWVASGSFQKEAEQRLERWQQELGKSIATQLKVQHGNPAEIILAQAKHIQPDLIVIGAKEAQSRGRYRSGTTVESVVRNAQSSVLVCRSEQISKILCGIDVSPHSARSLHWAIQFARAFSVDLTVACAMPRANLNLLGMQDEDIRQEEGKIKEECARRAEAFLKDFDFSGIKMKHLYAWGVPSHVLLDMAEDFEYDLMVIGAKGQNMLSHVLMGSTAEKILRFAPCSLLVVK